MKETGIIKRIEDRYLSDRVDQRNAAHPAVSFETVLAFFCVLVGGAVIAVILLLLEIITCKKNKSVQNKTTATAYSCCKPVPKHI